MRRGAFVVTSNVKLLEMQSSVVRMDSKVFLALFGGFDVK